MLLESTSNFILLFNIRFINEWTFPRQNHIHSWKFVCLREIVQAAQFFFQFIVTTVENELHFEPTNHSKIKQTFLKLKISKIQYHMAYWPTTVIYISSFLVPDILMLVAFNDLLGNEAGIKMKALESCTIKQVSSGSSLVSVLTDSF